MKIICVVYEAIINSFGFTQSKRRINSIFQQSDATNTRVNKLKTNLDSTSIKVIDALLYIASNKDKKVYKSKDVALYSKFYNMNLLHKLYYRLKYKIPFKFKLLQEVFHHKCGLQFVQQKELDYLQGKSSITAGAYFGDSSLVLHDITKAKVYGFEPNKHNYALFENIIAKNGKEDIIIPINKGLSKSSGVAYIDDTNMSAGSKLSTNNLGSKIEVVSIDDFIKENNINNLGLIHLDIEGLETDVIEGAKSIIAQHKPILLISIYHNAQDFFDLKPLIESWNLDYNFKIRKLARNRFELMLICTPKII